MNLARAKCLEEMILGLIKSRSVQLFRIAEEFSNACLSTETHRRRIQNFISLKDVLNDSDMASYIFALLNQKQKLILAIDRTNWKFGEHIHNLFVLAVIIDNNAVPLFIHPIDHMGNSDTAQRIALVTAFINKFGTHGIECIVGDREFVGDDWLTFLCEKNIPFVMRCRENISFKHQNGGKMLVGKWFEETNEKETVILTSIGKHSLYLTGKSIKHTKIEKKKNKKKTVNKDNAAPEKKEKNRELLVVISSMAIKNPLEVYKKRWGIECLFKSLKTHGFNLETSQIRRSDSFLTFVKIVSLAFAIAFAAGLALHSAKPIPFRKTVKSKLYSVFRYGLDFLRRNFKNNKRLLRCGFYTFKGVSKILGFFIT